MWAITAECRTSGLTIDEMLRSRVFGSVSWRHWLGETSMCPQGLSQSVENHAQRSGEPYLKDPKSAAGRRAVPYDLLDELKQHLTDYAGPVDDGRVLIGPMVGLTIVTRYCPAVGGDEGT
jgi:hypothetical protein